MHSHLRRLEIGSRAIGIPYDDNLRETIQEEAQSVTTGQNKAVLRVSLSMSEGGRGYLNPNAPNATRILSLHPYPEHPPENWQEGILLGMASIRLASQPALAGIKHGNRLEQIIARNQWLEGWQEALICDQNDYVVEATHSNVFIVCDGVLKTPDLSNCGVAGVMRGWVIETADTIGVKTLIVPLSGADIEAADEVFVTNSLIGLWPVKQFLNSVYEKPILANKLLNLMLKNEVIPSY